MSIVTDEQILDQIKDLISVNRIMLFMKGTPEAPRCGFSMRISQRLQESQQEFAALDVLVDPRIRQVLSAHSNWPTIPQLFVDGELVGGCDITMELHENGELAKIVKSPE
jgi:monothiol glutaredoxin